MYHGAQPDGRVVHGVIVPHAFVLGPGAPGTCTTALGTSASGAAPERCAEAGYAAHPARVEAVLRRGEGDGRDERVLRVADLVVDPASLGADLADARSRRP
jgi:hypothetical protein